MCKLRGEKFGRLTPIKIVGKTKGNKNFIWLCLCDCGEKSEVIDSNLTSGNTQSCGCIRRHDITNHRFGNLIAIKPTNKRIFKSVVWLCRCVCGRMTEKTVSDLRNVRVKPISCGCC